jgi:hypothetical protein
MTRLILDQMSCGIRKSHVGEAFGIYGLRLPETCPWGQFQHSREVGNCSASKDHKFKFPYQQFILVDRKPLLIERATPTHVPNLLMKRCINVRSTMVSICMGEAENEY